MPFTPFHMGPGLLVKALLQGSFSLMVFGWTQIAKPCTAFASTVACSAWRCTSPFRIGWAGNAAPAARTLRDRSLNVEEARWS